MLSANKKILAAIIGFVLISACNITKTNKAASNQPIALPQIAVTPPTKLAYQAAQPRVVDVVHMQLAVSFNYEQQFVYGQAILTCKPYFDALQNITLDAKQFTIDEIKLLKKNDSITLKYTYNNSKLSITLDTVYQRNTSFKVYIKYTAKPNQQQTQKGVAITDNKGLYFINPLKTDANKPRQIWTQGETQSNSCWFPTVDEPNEKITHELAITVDDKDITLSNGELMKSKLHNNGTRTDYWHQTKPHAPYLVMLAVGEFSQVKDYWRDSIAVDYYVEPAYKQYAKMVFGNTPEMMELYSKKLGVAYPWNKYSQIVVRDFVSGAMENTSAVVHYQALQHNHREHLDNTNEDIIAHELFHHWFGDLVTCESWSNISLNESFATYGEYIWQEHKYGLLEADCEFNGNLSSYLAQRQKHKQPLVRHYYKNADDLFDVISYQKGGHILHMLRKYIGDDAFFESLKLYLTQNAYKTAEVANLRMAFEEVTGKDLNWFFNQWFYRAGHPQLSYNYQYNTNRLGATLTINQTHDSSLAAYILPIKVDVYTTDTFKRYDITLTNRNEKIYLESETPISFINVDADKILLAEINDTKTDDECRAMIKRAPLYMDKYYAVKHWETMLTDSLTPANIQTLNYLLTHPFWGIRNLGLTLFDGIDSANTTYFEQQLLTISTKDEKAKNRADAITVLSNINANKHAALYKTQLNDSAYSVVSAAVNALAKSDTIAALNFVAVNKHTTNLALQQTIANLFAAYAKTNEVAFYENGINLFGRTKYNILTAYVVYLQRQDKTIQQQAIVGLKRIYKTTDDTTLKGAIKSCIPYLQAPWNDKLTTLNEQKAASKKDTTNLQQIEAEITTATLMMKEYAGIAE